MKAVTLRQPYASLVAAGVKTIETRPRACSYRGRIAIHAAQKAYILSEVPMTDAEKALPRSLLDVRGAVVASAVLTDCVPIVTPDAAVNISEGSYVMDTARLRGSLRFVRESIDENGRISVIDDIEDQLPLGDFSPGRWALLLDDIAPTTERCPACWGDAGYSDTEGVEWPCTVCQAHGRCDPVPARGQQAVPWTWEP